MSFSGTIFSRFIILGMFFSSLIGCSPAIQKTSYNTEEHWSTHPALALSLSQGIVDGVRTLIDDLLISESWFQDMDISIKTGKEELLRAKITDLILQPVPSMKLSSVWTIHYLTSPTLKHTKWIHVSNFPAETQSATATESRSQFDNLELEVYQQTSKLNMTRAEFPDSVEIVYWRDLIKREKIVSLNMVLRSGAAVYSTKLSNVGQ